MKIIIFFLIFVFALPALAYVPSDPMYPEQGYLAQINASFAWDRIQGQGSVVAVLDSGVDVDHPDLKMNVWRNEDEIPNDGIDNDHNGYIDDVNGWDFVSAMPSPKPKLEKKYDVSSVNHGTAISGLIAAVANNSKGITGLSFSSKIMPVRVMDGNGDGDVSVLIEGIKYAVNNKADVINLSLVGYDYAKELEDIVNWAEEKGVLIVSASGNGNGGTSGVNLNTSPSYPACYEKVIAVSALDENGKKSSFSNYGTCVDLSAPGEKITSLGYYDSTNPDFTSPYVSNWSGTSFSTALVSAAASLVKSKSNYLTPRQIKGILENSAEDISNVNPEYTGQLGSGQLDAFKAVEEADPFFRGKLIKLKDFSAVYYVEDGFKQLFPSERVFWSWHSGNWDQQDIQIVSQKDFDDLIQKNNIAVREGNLLKFLNSPKIYELWKGELCQVDEVKVKELYGENWQNKVLGIQPGFFTNYVLNPNCQ